MKTVKVYIKKEAYNHLIRNTIKEAQKRFNISEETATVMVYMSDLYNQFKFIIR